MTINQSSGLTTQQKQPKIDISHRHVHTFSRLYTGHVQRKLRQKRTTSTREQTIAKQWGWQSLGILQLDFDSWGHVSLQMSTLNCNWHISVCLGRYTYLPIRYYYDTWVPIQVLLIKTKSVIGKGSADCKGINTGHLYQFLSELSESIHSHCYGLLIRGKPLTVTVKGNWVRDQISKYTF